MALESLTVITGASSNHFRSLQNLLASLDLFEADSHVVVYDLGLRSNEAERLRAKRRDVRKFPFDRYPAHVNIRIQRGQYAWKPIIVADGLREFRGMVLWLDAGDLVLARLERIRKLLAHTGLYSPTSSATVERWTHPATLRYLRAEPELLNKPNRSGGVVGFLAGYRGIDALAEKWKACALDKNCIAPTGSHRGNHRQDQAVLTVLIYQFQKEYGYDLENRKLDISTHNDHLSPAAARRILSLASSSER